ncbi:MAG TPA: hypothetical protein DD649_13320 [Providencia sp.]|uniref:DUF6056 family protein n=2 Tax=Providencia sp. TaxID=589 RepID=UPI000E93AE83|nr:DUF6056 family protein [Providencia sp.]MBP6082237.1 hypothetical protein [Providencia sp.]HBO23851.1 hypothetical protein [Providencia sp.]
MTNYLNRFNLGYISILIVFSLIFLIEYYTPMHSDDYVYYIKGNSLSAHVSHYLSWSGRFVSDYFSTLVLTSNSNLLKNSIISFVLTTMLFLITKMSVNSDTSKKSFFLQFIFLFSIYWVTNPALGQIVFWVVGAANYLVTNFFIVIYLYLLFQYLETKKNITLLIISSFFAGCSNENTSWIIVAISVITSCYIFFKHNNKLIIFSSVFVILGFITLISSPGNFHRAALFTDFYSLSTIEKITYFLSDKVAHSFTKTWGVLLASLLLLTTYIGEKKSKSFYLSLLFIALGILSIFSMVASPTFPTRSLSGAHLFYIISCSFSIGYAFNMRNKKGITTTFFIGTLTLCGFIFSYIQMIYSYNTITNQEKIRIYEINKELIGGSETKQIPEYYYPRSFRSGDEMDLYHNPDAIAEYFKVSHPIVAYKINYNYAVILSGKKLPLPNTETTGVLNLFLGKDRFLKGTTIALQINDDETLIPNKNYKIIIMDNENKIHIEESNKIDSIYGMNLVGFTVPISPQSIKSINYIVDIDNKKIIEQKINL